MLSDNFDSENGGATFLNYTGFANWTVTGGTVDLVSNGDYGIGCAGGSAACVDLDGSTSQGGTLNSASIAFNSGDTVTFSFDLSGNQRGGSADNFFAGFNFGPNTLLTSYTIGGGFGNFTFGSQTVGGIGSSTSVNPSDPFQMYSISFVAGQSGNVVVNIGTDSADNVGPILDNALITQSAGRGVPEPSTWALMLGGIGLAGASLRRRRAIA